MSTLSLLGATEFGRITATGFTPDQVPAALHAAGEDWLQERRDNFPTYHRPPEFTVMRTGTLYTVGWYLEVPARHLKENR